MTENLFCSQWTLLVAWNMIGDPIINIQVNLLA